MRIKIIRKFTNIRKMRKIITLLNRLVREFIGLSRHYGISYAFYNLLWWLCFYFRTPLSYKISTFAIRKKTKWLDKYIGEKYKDIIDSYRSRQADEQLAPTDYSIWVFWGQGETEMPILVKACYNQLQRNNANVRLVTNGNLHEYIILPDIILTKVGDGRITWAHFSDIVRMTLLAKYGGLWLDATVWVPYKLPLDMLKSMPLFSANGTSGSSSNSIRFWTSFEWNWSGWCIGGNHENYILFSFVSDMLINIAEKENYLLDYVLIDYLIHYACRHFPTVCNDMDNIKKIPCNYRNDLASVMNEPYNADIYNKLIATDFVFKLSFRSPWHETTEQGQQTFYGRLVSTNNGAN